MQLASVSKLLTRSAGTDWLAGAVSSRTASASASAVSSTALAASWSAHAASSIASVAAESAVCTSSFVLPAARCRVLALFAVGDVYVSLCKKKSLRSI